MSRAFLCSPLVNPRPRPPRCPGQELVSNPIHAVTNVPPQIASAHSQARHLRAAAASDRAGASAGADRVAELQRLLDDVSAAREAEAAALSDARRAAAAAATARARAEQERDAAKAALRAAEGELEVSFWGGWGAML